jgi:WD40 repeat protein
VKLAPAALTLALLTATACGGGSIAGSGASTDASAPTSSPIHAHLVALGTPWSGGFPVYGVHVATLSRTGVLQGWDAGRNHLNWDSMALSPDGGHVAQVVNGTLYVYSSRSGAVRSLGNVGGLSLSPEWLPDGKRLSVIQRTLGRMQPGRTLLILDGRTGAVERRMALPGWADDIAYSSDGLRAAVSELRLTKPAGSTIAVLDLLTGKAAPILTIRHDLVDGLAWSPDGGHIAFATFGNGLHLISSDGEDDRTIWKPPFGLVGISAGSFAPDNRTLAVSWEADFNGADAPAANRGFLIDTSTLHGVRMRTGHSGIDGPFAWISGDSTV